MENYFDEELDKLFRLSANQYQVTYDPRDWERMRQKLEARQLDGFGTAFFKIWQKSDKSILVIKNTKNSTGPENLFSLYLKLN